MKVFHKVLHLNLYIDIDSRSSQGGFLWVNVKNAGQTGIFLSRPC
jgi:hypothetical protein